MEVIHKSEFGVSEQSSFVEIILILVNGHPRGGVSAFFREISAFTGGTNQGPAYYQECVSLFGKKVFMKPVNE